MSTLRGSFMKTLRDILLKELLFPRKYILKSIDRRLKELGPTLLEELKKQTVAGTATFKNHLEHLRARCTELEDEVEISHIFRQIAGRLKPSISTFGCSKIIVANMAIGEAFRSTIAPCVATVRDYAKARGYGFAELTEKPYGEDRHAAWYKIPFLYYLASRGYSRILYLDADCLVTNPSFRAEELFAEMDALGKSFYLSMDPFGVNTGAIFVRDTPQCRRILDLIWLNDLEHFYENPWEQESLNNLLKAYLYLTREFLITDNRKLFNAVAPDGGDRALPAHHAWSEGDFLVHFNGIRSPRLDSLIESYRSKARPAVTPGCIGKINDLVDRSKAVAPR
jgi:hypothetical protein